MRQSLIKSRNADNSLMSEADILSRAPAAFSVTKADHLTDRYQSLQTSSLLPILADYGYFPVQAAQTRPRKMSDVLKAAEHRHHLISFARAEDLQRPDRPEVTLFNSHNGSGAVRLFAGIYRMICSNGIVVGNGVEARIYHNKAAMMGFEDMLRKVVANVPEVLATMERMKSITLSYSQVVKMAENAVALRWQRFDPQLARYDVMHPKGVFYNDETVLNALSSKRLEDRGDNLYTVFNRIQENVMRGNIGVLSVSESAPFGTMRKARPVNSVKAHTDLNAKLWDAVKECI
jgi:hypothetical protein